MTTAHTPAFWFIESDDGVLTPTGAWSTNDQDAKRFQSAEDARQELHRQENEIGRDDVSVMEWHTEDES